MFALMLAWMGSVFAACNVWRKLEKRLYYNELQQAEADTLLGKHGDEVQALNVNIGDLRRRFNFHIDQYIGEVSIPEEDWTP